MVKNSSKLLLIIWLIPQLGIEMQILSEPLSMSCIHRQEQIYREGYISTPHTLIKRQRFRNEYDEEYEDPIEDDRQNVAEVTTKATLNVYWVTICTNAHTIQNIIGICGPCRKITYKDSNVSVIHTNTHPVASNLEEVHFSGLGIRKIESGAFGNLPQLKIINLDRNDLKKVSRGVFNSLINLKYLNLSHNSITELEEESFHGSPNITQIDLSYNRISVVPENFFQHFSLSFLNLSNNLLTTLGNDICVALPSLSSIILDENLFTDIPDMSRCVLVSHVSINSNLIHSINSTNLPPNLRELSIGKNRVQEITEGSCNSFKILLKLDVSYNNLKEIDQECLRKIHDLEYLDISGIQNKDINSDFFFHMTNLKKLHLTDNNITFLQKGVFQRLKRLILLDISKNKIGVLETGALNSLESLKVLNVSHNALEYLQSGVFNDLKMVEIIDLSSNNLEILSLHLIIPLLHLKQLNLNFNRLRTLEAEIYPYREATILSIDLDGNNFTCTSLAKLISDVHYRSVLINKGKTSSSENIDGISCSDNEMPNMKSENMDIVSDIKYFYQNDFKNTTFYKFFKNFVVSGKKEENQLKTSEIAEHITHNFSKGLSNVNAQFGEFIKFENDSFQHFLKELSVIVKRLETTEIGNETSSLELLAKSFSKDIETFANFENSTFQNFMNKLNEIAENMNENQKNTVNVPEIFEKLQRMNAEKWVNEKQSNDNSQLVVAIHQFKMLCMFTIFIVLVVLIGFKIWPYVKVTHLRSNDLDEQNQSMVLS